MDYLFKLLYYMLTMLGDLTFLHYGHMPRCKASVSKHFRDYYTLQYMTQGRVEVIYGKESYQLKAPCFWPAFPGPFIRFHRAENCASWNHRYVAFKGPLVGHYIKEGIFPKTPRSPPANKSFTTDFDALLKLLKKQDRLSHLKSINLLEKILIGIREKTDGASSRPIPWLEKAIAHLEKERGTEPAYESLAGELNMGLSTLRRNFKKETGVSLHLYALQCKIGEAKIMLGDSDLPLKGIAEALGYNDVYFFSKQFRQITGVPPGEYRKSRVR